MTPTTILKISAAKTFIVRAYMLEAGHFIESQMERG